MSKLLAVLMSCACVTAVWGGDQFKAVEILPFGEGGGIKMLYDARQRPQAVYLQGKVFIAFKGGGSAGDSAKPKTSPMLISYDPQSRRFSEALTLGRKTSDHHHGPIIWADEEDYLHILFGCHKTPGTHLLAKRPAEMGREMPAWTKGRRKNNCSSVVVHQSYVGEPVR